MTGEPIFYTNPMSRGRIARWMPEEAGAAYRTEIKAGTPAVAPRTSMGPFQLDPPE